MAKKSKKDMPKEPAERAAHRMACPHMSMGGSCMAKSGYVSQTCHILMGCTPNSKCRRLAIYDNKNGLSRDVEYRDDCYY